MNNFILVILGAFLLADRTAQPIPAKVNRIDAETWSVGKGVDDGSY